MTAIRLRQFGGIAPKLNPRYLPDERAQVALETDASRNGALVPLRDVGAELVDVQSGVKTLYRYNEDYLAEDGNWWIASSNDVDFCRSQIIDDSAEVTYFTDNDQAGLPPQFFYNANVSATDSVLYLSDYYGLNNSYDLGVEAPSAAPSATINNPETETDGLTREARTYVFTYVWAFAGREMESGPSPASSVVGLWLDSTESVSVDTLTTSPPHVQMASSNVTKRIYRAVAGDFFYVGEIPVTQQAFTDNVAPDDLGEVLPSLTWEVPPANLQGLTNMANGIVAGFDGRNVYFCEPYVPHAFPVQYAQSVDSPIVAIAALDTTLVVLTREKPFFIQGSHPEVMSVVEADFAQSCLSKRSVASINGEVYFVSPDGLVATSPRGSKIVTEQLFSYRQWQEFANLTSVHGHVHDLKYFGFHDGGAFIYDIPTGEFTESAATFAAAYTDLRNDNLFTVDSAGSLRIWGAGANRTATWRSKIFSFPSEISFSAIQVESEGYPVTLKVYTEGGLLHTYTVASRKMLRLPSILARDWYVEVETAYEVFNVAMAQAGSELANV